ncbi:MAG: polyprenyl synthetase family protein [Candidatus Aenigmarchaeota archaeon]|nr:polyprenyl synthetase family protein [Candidatus Aenigmarchaeota archaeon]
MADILSYLEEKKKPIDERLKQYIPEKADEGYLARVFGRTRYEIDKRAMENALAKPISDFLSRGGKRWRPALFLLIAESLGMEEKEATDFSVFVELLHNGSIMVDDVEDSSSMRRGKPTTHSIYGVDIAVNAGNFMYFLPLLILKEKHVGGRRLERAFGIYMQEMINIHAGQAMDIYWHKGNGFRITESHYLQMCAFKTGTLSRLAARLAVALCGGTKEQEDMLARFAESIGIAFQIQDDVLDITSSGDGREKFGKAYGNDIHEGKITLMVIHALDNAGQEEGERLKSILKLHTSDKKLTDEAISILKKCGSIEYAKAFSRKLVMDAWKHADKALEDSEQKTILKSFADFLVEREF